MNIYHQLYRVAPPGAAKWVRYQRCVEMSSVCGGERKIWTVTTPFQPARRSGAATGYCAHCYVGKACCLLLVRTVYARGSGPDSEGTGTGESLKLLRSGTRFRLRRAAVPRRLRFLP